MNETVVAILLLDEKLIDTDLFAEAFGKMD